MRRWTWTAQASLDVQNTKLGEENLKFEAEPWSSSPARTGSFKVYSFMIYAIPDSEDEGEPEIGRLNLQGGDQ